MFKPTRLAATALFIGSIVMVFVSAFALGIDGLVILFAVTTYLVRSLRSLFFCVSADCCNAREQAFLWYSLSCELRTVFSVPRSPPTRFVNSSQFYRTDIPYARKAVKGVR
jgi:hypothetical protein